MTTLVQQSCTKQELSSNPTKQFISASYPIEMRFMESVGTNETSEIAKWEVERVIWWVIGHSVPSAVWILIPSAAWWYDVSWDASDVTWKEASKSNRHGSEAPDTDYDGAVKPVGPLEDVCNWHNWAWSWPNWVVQDSKASERTEETIASSPRWDETHNGNILMDHNHRRQSRGPDPSSP